MGRGNMYPLRFFFPLFRLKVVCSTFERVVFPSPPNSLFYAIMCISKSSVKNIILYIKFISSHCKGGRRELPPKSMLCLCTNVLGWSIDGCTALKTFQQIWRKAGDILKQLMRTSVVLLGCRKSILTLSLLLLCSPESPYAAQMPLENRTVILEQI